MVYTTLSDPLSNFSIICKNSLTKNIPAARLDDLSSIRLSFSYLDRYSWFGTCSSSGNSQQVGPKISEIYQFSSQNHHGRKYVLYSLLICCKVQVLPYLKYNDFQALFCRKIREIWCGIGYSGIPIFPTFKGNNNWSEKS